MKAYMLHAGWTQIGIGLFDMHDVWGPPCPPGPVLKYIPGVLDAIAPMGWPGGHFITHKKTKTIRVDGGPVLQQGHDAGYFMFHIPFVANPPNMMQFVIHNILSKHKVSFPITRVIVEKKPMGTYFLRVLGGGICSNPVSLPTGLLVPMTGTVHAGMELRDILLGLAFIIVDLIIDMLWSKVMKSDKWRTANTSKWSSFAPGSFPKSVIPVGPRQFPLGPARPAFSSVVDRGSNALGRVAGTKLPAAYKGMLERIYSAETMTAFTAQNFSRLLGQKMVDHVAKSWVASPLIAGLTFQIAALSPGISSKEVPSIAIGRSGAHFSFWPAPGFKSHVFN